tara:strand:+ start:3470 stop:4147 length:678 start_codon:yes stop_codon:yes gene_type:complete
MKMIYIDIETKNKFLSGLNFKRPEGWLISCLCIYDSYTGNKYYFVESKEEIISHYEKETLSSVKSDIFKDLYNFTEVEDIMNNFYKEGYTLNSFNGLNFDYPIMGKPIRDGGVNLAKVIHNFELDNRTKDLFFDLNLHTDINFSLQNLIKGVIGSKYSKSMKSASAPIQWSKKQYIEVLMYCMLDCIYTSEVFNRLENPDVLYSIDYKRYGKVHNCNLQNYEIVK